MTRLPIIEVMLLKSNGSIIEEFLALLLLIRRGGAIVFLNRGDVKHHPSREDSLNRQAWSGEVVNQVEIKISEFLVSPDKRNWNNLEEMI